MEKFPKEPSPENLENEILKLLEELDSRRDVYDNLSLVEQDEWYAVEMEARVAKNREAAKTHLKEFLKYLKQT